MHLQPQQTFAKKTEPEKSPDLVPADKNSLAQPCRRYFLGITEDSDLMLFEIQTRLVVLMVLPLLAKIFISILGLEGFRRRIVYGMMFLLMLALLIPFLRCRWRLFREKSRRK